MNTVLIIDVANLYQKYYHVNKDKGYIDPAITGSTQLLQLIHRNNLKDISSIYFVLEGENANKIKQTWYKEYKNKRQKDDNVYRNFNDFLALLSHYPKSTILRNNSREADDVIALLTKKYYKKSKVLIYSNDKDLIQLCSLSSNVKIIDKYKEGKFVELTNEQIFDKFKNSKGEEPFTRISNNLGDILKYRVLTGDSSDGIPSPIKRLSDKDKKKIIEVWEEDYLDQKVLGNIIIKLSDSKLQHKLAENFDKILLNYKLMNLMDSEKDHVLKKETKKISNKVSDEKLKEICGKYNALSYYRMLFGDEKE